MSRAENGAAFQGNRTKKLIRLTYFRFAYAENNYHSKAMKPVFVCLLLFCSGFGCCCFVYVYLFKIMFL